MVSIAKGFAALIGERMKKKMKFMNSEIEISKLTVAEVMEIQEEAKNLEKDESKGYELMRKIIQLSVEGAANVSDEDFNKYPLDELNKLSNEIMKFSGISNDKAGND